MKQLIRYCMEHRLLVFLVFAALAVAGFMSFSAVPMDAIPDLGENQVIVYADWPGRTPKDVEDHDDTCAGAYPLVHRQGQRDPAAHVGALHRRHDLRAGDNSGGSPAQQSAA